MMRKIIPCLDVKDGRVVKGTNFVGLKDVGSPIELAQKYDQEGADELIMLDITKTNEGHEFMLDTITKVSQAISIPLSIGGGISSIQDIETVLNAGASRVSINTAAIDNPDLINEASKRFSPEAVTVAIDVSYDDEEEDYFVYTKGGKQKEMLKAFDWLKECRQRGAGALLITSIDHDGVKGGFDISFFKKLEKNVDIPIIASGGAGQMEDFVELFKQTKVQSGLAASIFHQEEVNIPELKEILKRNKIEVE